MSPVDKNKMLKGRKRANLFNEFFKRAEEAREKKKSKSNKGADDHRHNQIKAALHGNPHGRSNGAHQQLENTLIDDMMSYLIYIYSFIQRYWYEQAQKMKEELASQADKKERIHIEEERTQGLAAYNALQEKLKLAEAMLTREIDAWNKLLCTYKEELKAAYLDMYQTANKHYSGIADQCDYAISFYIEIMTKNGMIKLKIDISSKEAAHYLAAVMPALLVNGKYTSRDIDALQQEQIERYMQQRIRTELVTLIEAGEIDDQISIIAKTKGYRDAKDGIGLQINAISKKSATHDQMRKMVDHARSVEGKIVTTSESKKNETVLNAEQVEGLKFDKEKLNGSEMMKSVQNQVAVAVTHVEVAVTNVAVVAKHEAAEVKQEAVELKQEAAAMKEEAGRTRGEVEDVQLVREVKNKVVDEKLGNLNQLDELFRFDDEADQEKDSADTISPNPPRHS